MKLSSLGVFGLGYLVGTRAGRERYEQIRVLAARSARRLEAYGAGGTLAQRLGADDGPRDSGPPA